MVRVTAELSRIVQLAEAPTARGRGCDMAAFYLVTISKTGRAGVSSRERIQETLDLAFDWYRYNDNTWVIFTNKDAKAWYRLLEKFAKPGGQLLIARLDMNDKFGWMPKTFWKWIEDNLKKQV